MTSIPTNIPAAPPEFLWQQTLAFFAVGMLIVARLQERSYPRFHYVSIVCAIACTICGFRSGAWPLGLALGAFTIRLLSERPQKHLRQPDDCHTHSAKVSHPWVEPTRLERLFGLRSSE